MRTYYFKDKNGVKNQEELARAMEHFHILLPEADLDMLFRAFPSPQGGFDFTAFADAIYPPNVEQGVAVDFMGRAQAPKPQPVAPAAQQPPQPVPQDSNPQAQPPAVQYASGFDFDTSYVEEYVMANQASGAVMPSGVNPQTMQARGMPGDSYILSFLRGSLSCPITIPIFPPVAALCSRFYGTKHLRSPPPFPRSCHWSVRPGTYPACRLDYNNTAVVLILPAIASWCRLQASRVCFNFVRL